MIGIIPEIIIELGVFGFMLIYIVCLMLSALSKYSGVLTFPIMIIIGLDYWEHYASGNNELFWLSIFSWLGSIFIIFETVVRMKK